ncbi:MAG TPA: FliM/FliN family flagellar motor switch protein [Gaiellales bacterium]|nr:FliM/FliN family flagellar motor switch protein [Gaiellales bacterium]
MSDAISEPDTTQEEQPAEAAPKRRARRVREIDFSRPSKFAQDQQRRLERAHESFCRTASQRLSTELLTPIELEVLSLDQLTWSSSIAQVQPHSISAIVEFRPLGTQVLFTAELEFMLRLVERLLGGDSPTAIEPRELTEIELALVRRMLDTLLEQLSLTWKELAGVAAHLLSVESQIANVNLAPMSEPSLVLTMEAKVDGAASTMCLILPHRAVEPILHHLSRSGYGEVEIDPGAQAAVRTGVAAVEVDIRAEVASRHMPIEEMLALRPGDILRFRVPAAEGVTLFAGHVPAHRAQPGRNGNRRAIQVTGRAGAGS